jgi:putative transposase
LPHFESPKSIQSITFRLADSLPSLVLDKLELDLKRMDLEGSSSARRKRLDFYLDSGLGSCVLADPKASRKVEDALLHFDGDRYRLLAWVVMPNHVHVVIETLGNWTLAKIVQSWKSYTARWIRANEASLSRRFRISGADQPRGVWQREYWDRFIRDDDHFRKVVEYIHQNPVRAGLVADARDWQWSSAYEANS